MHEHYFANTIFRCAFAHTGGHRAFCRDTRVLLVVEGKFLGYERVGDSYRDRGYEWPGEEDLLLAAGWERIEKDDGSPVVAVVRGMKGVSFGGPSYLRRADAVYDSVEDALCATDPVFAAQLGCWVENERGGRWWNAGGGPYMTGSWDEVIPSA